MHGAMPIYRKRVLQAGTAATILIATAFLAGLAFYHWTNYQASRVQAELFVEGRSAILAEHAARVLDVIDNTLVRLVAVIEEDLSGHDRPTPALQEVLRRATLETPSVQSLWVTDQHGILIAENASYQPKANDLSGRDYFQAFAGKPPGDKAFLGSLIQGQRTGTWFQGLSHAYERSGAFAGVIAAAVDPKYFENFYRTQAAAENKINVFLTKEGVVVASWPPLTEDGRPTTGLPINTLSWTQDLPSLRGGDLKEGYYEGENYIASVKDVSGYPLDVVVLRSRTLVTQEWQDDLLLENGIVIVFISALGIFTWQRHRAERAIQQSALRLRAILDTMLDTVVTIDGSGRITEINPAGRKLFGYDERAIIGRPVSTLMAHAPSTADAVMTRALRGLGGLREELGLSSDGKEIPIELSLTELRTGPDLHYTAVIRDISERQRVQRLKDEFVSTVSHELRTPLTSIRGSLGLVAAGAAGVLPEKAKALVDIAHKNSERLVLLVNDILDIEKIESGRMEFRMQPIDLSSLIEQALAANHGYAEQFGVSLAMRRPAESIMVNGDSGRLMQVMGNLLSNAIKFSPQCSEVEVSVSVDQGTAQISVRDRGQGIALDFQDRIFERFAQADASNERKAGGTGLGLSITKAIVDRHGGRIHFETDIGRGTTFLVALPTIPPNQSSQTGLIIPRSRILVCEDDPDVAQLLRLMLERQGFLVDLVLSADEALARLQDSGRVYQAATIDLLLPDMSGATLIHTIRSLPHRSAMPIVVVSAYAQSGIQELAGEALGVIDWLDKPVDEGRLTAVLRHAIKRHDGHARILHVEDDGDVTQVVGAIVEGIAEFTAVSSVTEARRALAQSEFELIIIDVGLPDGSGLELIGDLRNMARRPHVLVFSANDLADSHAREIAATLVKSKTSNNELLASIMHLIGSVEPSEPVNG